MTCQSAAVVETTKQGKNSVQPWNLNQTQNCCFQRHSTVQMGMLNFQMALPNLDSCPPSVARIPLARDWVTLQTSCPYLQVSFVELVDQKSLLLMTGSSDCSKYQRKAHHWVLPRRTDYLLVAERPNQRVLPELRTTLVEVSNQRVVKVELQYQKAAAAVAAATRREADWSRILQTQTFFQHQKLVYYTFETRNLQQT